MCIFDIRTGQALSTRTFVGLETDPPSRGYFWSADCRAVAFAGEALFVTFPQRTGQKVVDHDPGRTLDVTIWRAGERVRNISCRVVNSSPASWDYLEDAVWSPGNDYLLMRYGGSGMADINNGWVYCLDIARGRAYFVGLAGGTPLWAGARTVKLWGNFDYDDKRGQYVRPNKPFMWHVPMEQHRLRYNKRCRGRFAPLNSTVMPLAQRVMGDSPIEWLGGLP